MITIKDLIQELTDATESSRQLDVKIGYVIDFHYGPRSLRERVAEIGFDAFMEDINEDIRSAWHRYIPRYTSSLNAALSLIPGGETASGPQRMDFILEHVNGGLTISAIVGSKNDEDRKFGSTDALAICIGALHARART